MRRAPRVTESRVLLLDSFVSLQWSGDMRSRHEMTALDAPSQRVGRLCLRCLIGKPDWETLGSDAMSYGPDRGQIAQANDTAFATRARCECACCRGERCGASRAAVIDSHKTHVSYDHRAVELQFLSNSNSRSHHTP